MALAPFSPQYVKGCPPNGNEYNAFNIGSYASSMLWRGFVPVVGGFLQKNVQPPPTCQQQNNDLQGSMQKLISQDELSTGTDVDQLWNIMNEMLIDLQYAGGIISALMVTPVQGKLLYLFAGTTALTLLCVAILLSI